MKGKLTIARTSSNEGQSIRIRVKDDLSRAEFVEVTVGLADFAACLTGLSYVDVDFEVRALDKVGLLKVSEPAEFVTEKSELGVLGMSEYDRGMLEELLRTHPRARKDGWTNNSYLGQQGSIKRDNGVITMKFSRYRYLQADGQPAVDHKERLGEAVALLESILIHNDAGNYTPTVRAFVAKCKGDAA